MQLRHFGFFANFAATSRHFVSGNLLKKIQFLQLVNFLGDGRLNQGIQSLYKADKKHPKNLHIYL